MSLLPRDDALTLDARRQIDALCLAFEDEWLAGRRPVVEAYLDRADSTLQPVLLKELLLLELDYRRSIGETPQLDDYLARFPVCEARVRAAFHRAVARHVTMRHLPGTLIGRYRVRRMLGAGAFAAVYLAWDEQLQREVAVKVPHASRLGNAGDRQRFVAEARAVARLRHPRIVAIYDAAELEDGTVYLVMQYVAGESLRQLINHGPVPSDEACHILMDVADAIDAAHRTGIIHRDLKPSNILLDELGQPHVCDFGLALEESQQRERRGEYAGTLAYMAPEQLRGQTHQLDGRADVWAAGVILYEMLTGRLPFLGRDREELTEEILTRDPRPPRQINRRIGRPVERVCLRCLEKRPGHRYPTASDMADELRRAHSRARHGWRITLSAAMVAVALLSSLAIAVWLTRSRPDLAGAPPLQGVVELTVWNSAQPLRQGLPLVDDRAVPLRTGDCVRLAVALNRPAHAYLVWLDAQGVPAPVYPWRRGDWRDRPADGPSTMHISLPEELDSGWTVHTPHTGMETLLLLVRPAPLPAQVDLQLLLSDLPRTPVPFRRHVVKFQQGRPLPSGLTWASPTAPDPDRGATLDQPVAIDDPLLKLQREVVRRLRPHFELIHAVSFPVQGD